MHYQPAEFVRFCSRCRCNAESKFCIHCGSETVAATQSVDLGAAVIDSANLGRAHTQNNCPPCLTCDSGMRFSDHQVLCLKCNRLKPMWTGHGIDPRDFQWAMAGQTMEQLRNIPGIVETAKSISDQVGKPWIEATYSGIRLGPDQLPEIYGASVHAARLLGLPQMPEIYVTGDVPWNMLTFGSDAKAFIIMGSALANTFRGRELVFLFAREMGHILAGHALWKTVNRFMMGDRPVQSGLMRGGLTGLLSPTRWLNSAFELPMIAWARQAEITADRAALLALGDFALAQRVLLTWTFKSPQLVDRINLAAWLEQQRSNSSDDQKQLAEVVTSPTPYIARRLHLLSEFSSASVVDKQRQRLAALAAPASSSSSRSPLNKQSAASDLRVSCPQCKREIKVAANELQPHAAVKIRCTQCNCVHVMRRRTVTSTAMD